MNHLTRSLVVVVVVLLAACEVVALSPEDQVDVECAAGENYTTELVQDDAGTIGVASCIDDVGAGTLALAKCAGPLEFPAQSMRCKPVGTPVTTTTTATTTTAPPSGFTPIFTETFDTPAAEGQFIDTYGETWAAYPYGWLDTSRHGTYDPGIISVAAGTMRMRLHTAGGIVHVAAPYPLLPVANVQQYGTPNRPQLYGRYSVRFRADLLDGYKVAWLLWPMSDVWPRDGEIDFPEGDLTGTVSAFLHHQGATSGSDQDAHPTPATFTPWHTAVIEWTPAAVRFYLDGTLIGTSTSRIPSTPMRWVLQTETELAPSPAPAASTAGVVEVDDVKVWSWAP